MVDLDVIKLSWIREYFEIPMSIFIPSFVIYVKQGGGHQYSYYQNIIMSFKVEEGGREEGRTRKVSGV